MAKPRVERLLSTLLGSTLSVHMGTHTHAHTRSHTHTREHKVKPISYYKYTRSEKQLMILFFGSYILFETN